MFWIGFFTCWFMVAVFTVISEIKNQRYELWNYQVLAAPILLIVFIFSLIIKIVKRENKNE